MQGGRLIFPLFNSIIVLIVGGGTGYLVGPLWLWLIISWVSGLLLGLLAEFILSVGGRRSRLYRGRVLLLVLLEVPVFLFVIGPYVFVFQRTKPYPHDICCMSPTDFGANYENIQFETDDGYWLHGWYIAPQEEGDALIILLHGINGNRTLTLTHAAMLYEVGYGLLMYDERALGESEGNLQSFGWLDAADVSDAIDFVQSKPEVNPEQIGVVGLSLGGHIALVAAALDERIKAVWVDGVAAQHAADYPDPINSADYVMRFYYGLVDFSLSWRLGMSGEPIVDMIELIRPRPIFFVAGGATELEGRAGENYVRYAGANAQLWIIPDAGHVNGSMIAFDDYRQRLIDFFDGALRTEDKTP